MTIYENSFTGPRFFRWLITLPLTIPLMLFTVAAYYIEDEWDWLSRIIGWVDGESSNG